MSLLRRELRPGLGQSLHGVRRPRWWRRTAATVTVCAWLLRRGWRTGRWLARHPRTVAALAVLAGLSAAADRWGTLPVAGGLLATAAGAGVWLGRARPATRERLLWGPLRSGWRRTWTYRWLWRPAMATAGLSISRGGLEHWPTLGRVRAGTTRDVVRVRMLPGQTVANYGKAAEALAQTFGVLRLQARGVPTDPRVVELHCATTDPLTEVVPVPAPRPQVNLRAVPVGRLEDGGTLTLPLLYAHVLVGGETGAGKGSVLWSLLCGVAPAIADGLVKVWAVDPKGGMELGQGGPLFDRFSYRGPEDAAALLEDAVRGMRARAERLRAAGVRKLEPTTADPLIVVVVDELAALIAYVTEPKLRRRLTDAVSLLLSQGRAVGVCVVGASQDVRKDTLALRDLFPVRVALRAAEDEQADMLLGRGSRERGALTDRISPATPGVGYVVQEGRPEPVRVRFAHVTDAHIARVVGQHQPRPRLAVVTEAAA